MAIDRNQQMNKLKAEVRALEGNPIFQEYLKLSNVQETGLEILTLINNKLRMLRALEQRGEPFQHLRQQEDVNPNVQSEEFLEDEPSATLPEPPMPRPQERRQAPPQMKQQLRQRQQQPVSPQRERELDKKVAMLDATPEEMGQVDDLELPDIEMDDEPEEKYPSR